MHIAKPYIIRSFLLATAIFMMLLADSCLAQQDPKNKVIFWAEDRVLELQDFRVVSDNITTISEHVSALTRTGITYYLTTDKINGRAVSIRITIQATVHTANTFIRERVLDMSPPMKEVLLNHEQKHFDISEIFAREATHELQTLKLTSNYKKEIGDFVQAKFKEAEAYQRLYDWSTYNGEDMDSQQTWDDKISRRLRELEKYKKKIVVRKL